MNICIVAGARPNFIKIAPIIKALIEAQNRGCELYYKLVHTGQHYDYNMSDTFFKELNIPKPNVNLNAKGLTQAEQTAAIMILFERYLIHNPADIVLVVGDVTSTLACSIVAKKLRIKVAHVEAGIRSFDISMPEEINRLVTDSITDYYFTTSEYANQNLIKAGISNTQIFFVGNVMIDTLLEFKNKFSKPAIFGQLGLQLKKYIVLTMHRPSNVDDEEILKVNLQCISENVEGIPIIFPIHPRTNHIINKLGVSYENLHIIDPLGYLEFNYLVENSMAVITDSGGITEETTVMGIPCITLRINTERPETVIVGTNEIIGTKKENLAFYCNKLLNGNWKKGTIPELWDGKAAIRIVNELIKISSYESN